MWNFNFNQMKKLIYLFLTLFTAVSYGQADFPEGVQISGGQPTTTTDPYITTTGSGGLQGKVPPENIPVTITPPTTFYTPVTSDLKGHLQGIDNALGDIPLTTAGNTTRVWFTGDAITIGAGTFYLTNATGKGSVANVSQSVTNDDNQKKYFTQDLIGNAFATATLFPPGVYAGNLSASTTPNSAQQRFTVELYKCDTNGTPIASGVSGAPVGDLGVTVILILDSGLLTLADGSVTNVPISASLASQLSVAVGERIRYHVSAEKVGTVASNITESVWYGSSFNSFLDVPTPITSSGVSNVSTVTGASVTNALDNLNTGKENISNKAVDYSVVNNTLYPTVQASKTQLDLKVSKSTSQTAENAYVNLFKINPFTSGFETFGLDFNSYDNTGGGVGTFNHGAWFGFNTGWHSQAPTTTGKPSIMVGLEDNYFDNDYDMSFGTEFYVEGNSPDGTTVQMSRPFYARGQQKNDGTNSWLTFLNIGSSGTYREFRLDAGLSPLLKVVPTLSTSFINMELENGTVNTTKSFNFKGNRSNLNSLGDITWTNSQIDNTVKAKISSNTDTALNNASLNFYTTNDGSAVSERMRVTASGNILIGTTTDNTVDKLQVNGTVSGSPATLSNQFVTKAQLDTKQNTLTNPITGTGTTNTIPKFTGASTLGNSIITDNGALVDISGGAGGSIDTRLSISGSGNGGTGRGTAILMNVPGSTNSVNGVKINAYTTGGATSSQSVDLAFDVALAGVLGEKMRIKSNGNTLIGTTTDTGEKLQVNGGIKATTYNGSATLTGTPTAPTATAGTNTTQIATTAFVQAATSSGTYTPSYSSLSNITSPNTTKVNYSIIGKLVTVYVETTVTVTTANTASSITLSIPFTASSIASITGQGTASQLSTQFFPMAISSVSDTTATINFYPTVGSAGLRLNYIFSYLIP